MNSKKCKMAKQELASKDFKRKYPHFKPPSQVLIFPGHRVCLFIFLCIYVMME